MKQNLTFTLLLLSLIPFVKADDWPQWRGPQRDGVWREQGLIDAFSSPEPAAKWRAPIGTGYNGPTVAKGRVYVMDRQTEPTETERVLCFDSKTGEPLWDHTYACKYQKIQYKAGPRASVTLDQGRAFSVGAMANLLCLNAETGDLIWEKDLRQLYNPQVPVWGFSASPLVYKSMVIVQIGGRDNACLVAFDKATGKEMWRQLNSRASYSSPIIISQADQSVLVCWTGEFIVGLNPDTGAVHWKLPLPPHKMVINIPDPVLDGNNLFLSGFYDGSTLVKIDPDKLSAYIKWKRIGQSERNTDALHCCISTPIVEGSHIYGVDSYGELRCLSVKNGDRIWESQTPVPKARWANIHMVRQGDRFWFFTERGDLIICRMTPQGYKEISRAKIIEPTTSQLNQRGGVCWSHPAFANQCVFARNDKELVCIDVAQSPTP
ncbi:MAG: PQQ-binding-like beta-propeller repeat protein [Planctomycetes bacterium]|nr:PQQ-binding-like beta-propeller repeat protein [Planctomycetota bacterium]